MLVCYLFPTPSIFCPVLPVVDRDRALSAVAPESFLNSPTSDDIIAAASEKTHFSTPRYYSRAYGPRNGVPSSKSWLTLSTRTLGDHRFFQVPPGLVRNSLKISGSLPAAFWMVARRLSRRTMEDVIPSEVGTHRSGRIRYDLST